MLTILLVGDLRRRGRNFWTRIIGEKVFMEKVFWREEREVCSRGVICWMPALFIRVVRWRGGLQRCSIRFERSEAMMLE